MTLFEISEKDASSSKLTVFEKVVAKTRGGFLTHMCIVHCVPKKDPLPNIIDRNFKTEQWA